MMKIAFRVDASVAIGTGHFARCLCLADALRRIGFSITFAGRDLPSELIARLEFAGHNYLALPIHGEAPGDIHEPWSELIQQADVKDTIAGCDPEIVVIDHYALGTVWERTAKAFTSHLVVIDDLGRAHDCDVLLDQNYSEGLAARYEGKLQPGTRKLLGPRFALLRNEFAGMRDRMKRHPDRADNLLVFMGGTDPSDATQLVLESLALLKQPPRRVDVVMGSSAPKLATVAATSAAMGYQLHVDTDKMAQLLADADLAIGAGGGAVYERLAVGLPTAALCLAENQRPGLLALAKRRLIALVDDPQEPASIAGATSNLMADVALRTHMTEEGMTLVDGRGAERVAAQIASLRVKIRRAVTSDNFAIFAWRNNPKVIAASRNKDPVTKQDHDAWFGAVLSDPTRHLLVGEINGDAVGVVRFDCSNERAELSIYVVPERIGRGHGTSLLLAAEAWLTSEVPAIRHLLAEILPANAASGALFERCDYRRKGHIFEKDLCP